MPYPDRDVGKPGGNVHGTPNPPQFDHLSHADTDRLEALESWVDGFEAYCVAFYGHEEIPAAVDIAGNSHWKRLLRIALAPATTSIVRNKFPDIKNSSVSYKAMVDHLRHQFGSLKSKYVMMNTL